MAPTHPAGDFAADPAGGDSAGSDSPEMWGNDGMVGEGRYRLTRRLGRGGMAEVFAAEDVRLGREVAIKLLRADLAQDTVAKARFTREAQAVAGLNHHAVVAVYDSGEDVLANGETVPFIVMELVQGRTIRDLLINAEAPPVDQALLIVSGVLEALAYSHSHGIVHRDIKPANVIITDQGAVKVMDFGIARAMHSAASTMTQTGMVMGTPQYLSPEQALGRAVDERSDLYATGCMLYELLALRPPFTGETPLSVVYQHVQDDPKIPSEITERVPPELDGLVLRSLAKEPDDRYQSAEEMRGEIQYALQMLGQEGGYTGTWATGHFASPQGGSHQHTPVAGTVALGSSAGATSQLPPPVLLGPSNGPGPGGRGGSRRGGWRKPVLFAVAAMIAVSAGIFGAVHMQTKDSPASDRKNDNKSSTGTSEGRHEPTPREEAPSESSPTEGDGFGLPEAPTDQQSSFPSVSDSPTVTPSSNSTGGEPTRKPSPKPSASSSDSSPATPPTDGPGTSTGTSAGGGESDAGTTQGTEGAGAAG